MKVFALAASVLAITIATQVQAKSSAEKTPPPHSHHTHAYAEFPPVNSEGNITYHPEYYWGNRDYTYMYHGGYWWYPHASADALTDYTPSFYEGAYWYPSMQHPHMVYVTGDPVVYVYPHPMDKPMDDNIGSPMDKDHSNAPEVK